MNKGKCGKYEPLETRVSFGRFEPPDMGHFEWFAGPREEHKIDDEISSVFDKMINMKIEESNRYIYGNGSASEIIVSNILSLS